MAKEKKLVEAITDMEKDFPQWYTDVVKKADLTDYSQLKGCMIIRPYGYAYTRKPFTKRKRPCGRVCT